MSFRSLALASFAIAFGAMILVLLVRPSGLFGKKQQ